MLALAKNEQVVRDHCKMSRMAMENNHYQYQKKLLNNFAKNHPCFFAGKWTDTSWKDLFNECEEQLRHSRQEWKKLEHVLCTWDRYAESGTKEELIQRIGQDWQSQLNHLHPFPPKCWEKWTQVLGNQDWSAMKHLLCNWWQEQMIEAAKKFTLYWAPLKECSDHIALRWEGLCASHEEMKSKMLNKCQENRKLKGANKIKMQLVQISQGYQGDQGDQVNSSGMGNSDINISSSGSGSINSSGSGSISSSNDGEREKFFEIELDLKQHGFRKLDNIAQYYGVPPEWEWILSGIGRVSRSIVLQDYVWPEDAHLKLVHVSPYVEPFCNSGKTRVAKEKSPHSDESPLVAPVSPNVATGAGFPPPPPSPSSPSSPIPGVLVQHHQSKHL